METLRTVWVWRIALVGCVLTRGRDRLEHFDLSQNGPGVKSGAGGAGDGAGDSCSRSVRNMTVDDFKEAWKCNYVHYAKIDCFGLW